MPQGKRPTPIKTPTKPRGLATKRRSVPKGRKVPRPCTYEMGYVRQDLYALRKAGGRVESRDEPMFAFCAGCRETCYADHLDQVFELYTKRSFRCDCGTRRAGNVCRLNADKDHVNIGNVYSHNFESRYCRCDTEYDVKLAMAQCAMCEDWFHEQCYKTDAHARGASSRPFVRDYELICKDCVKKLPILLDYYEILHAWSASEVLRERPEKGRVIQCCRPPPPQTRLRPGSIDLCWRDGFRQRLCRCAECTALYASSGHPYIADPSDFVGLPQEDFRHVFDEVSDEALIEEDDPEVEEVRPVRNVNENSVRQRAKEYQDYVRAQHPKMATPVAIAEDDCNSILTPEQINCIRSRIHCFLSVYLESSERFDEMDLLAYATDVAEDYAGAPFVRKIERTDEMQHDMQVSEEQREQSSP